MTAVGTAPNHAQPEVDALPPFAGRAIAALVAAVIAVHLVVLTRYGWHRDEFYYVACGRHLAWGYPDQPPVTPLLARLLAVGGLTGLRLGALAGHVATITATAALARELGGTKRAQLIAGAAIAACPVFSGAALLFGTTVLDQMLWAVVLFLVARALRVGTAATWLAAGVAAGVGLETKQTIVVLVAGALAGLVVTRREILRSPWPWIAGGIALLMWAPNLWWDGTHGWANLAMASVLARKSGGAAGATLQLPFLALLALSPFLVPLWWSGVRWLRHSSQHRWLLVAAASTVGVFTAAGGKPYYPAPIFAALFAAGAIGAQRWRPAIALPASFLIGATATLPLFPPTVASRLRPLDPVMIETYGWRRVAAEVAAAARQTPQATSVFTSNYGEAGALTWYGQRAGLRLPISSGHNAYGYWGPPEGPDTEVLAVGEWDSTYLHKFWAHVTEIGPITMPAGIVDEETANHARIYLVEQPLGTWEQLWPRLRHLD